MPSTVVGLDIGRTAVRGVELRGGRRPAVRRAGRVALPPGAVEGGCVNDADAVTDALRTLWREARIGSRDVRLGVCSGSVLVRQLELDWMPQADLRRALRYQVADLLPVAVDDANLDHVHLGDGEVVDEESGRTRRVSRILLVATARGGVDELVRCVRAAGLRPQTADLSPLALVRAAAQATTEADERTTPVSEAVVDIGTDKTAVAVHTGGIPRFVRVATGLGGDTVTRAVMEHHGLTWEQAEAAKTGEPDPETARAIDAATERLVADIRTTLDYHASVDPDHAPTRAVLTGGGAAHAGVLDHCTRLLGMPVRRLEAAEVARRHATRPRADAGDDEAATSPATDDRDLLIPIGLCLGAGA